MSIAVIPFDDTLPARFRDRVTHYLNCRISGTGCDDVFSPVSYNLPPVFSAELLEGGRQTGEALQQAPFIHATAYENSISMPAHDGDDLLSIPLSAQNAPLKGKRDLHHVLIRLPPRANDISEVQG